MKVKEIYEYEYNDVNEVLTIEFSLIGDDINSYRLVEIFGDEIPSYLGNPTILEEYSVEDILEEPNYVFEILQYYCDFNMDNLPPEEFM
jgi:hypothetical protein